MWTDRKTKVFSYSPRYTAITREAQPKTIFFKFYKKYFITYIHRNVVNNENDSILACKTVKLALTNHYLGSKMFLDMIYIYLDQ